MLIKTLSGEELVQLAEHSDTREQAVDEAKRRIANGSKSRFAHAVVAQYAVAQAKRHSAKVKASTPVLRPPTREDQLKVIRKMASEDARRYADEFAPEGQFVKTVRSKYAELRDLYTAECEILGVLLPV